MWSVSLFLVMKLILPMCAVDYGCDILRGGLQLFGELFINLIIIIFYYTLTTHTQTHYCLACWFVSKRVGTLHAECLSLLNIWPDCDSGIFDRSHTVINVRSAGRILTTTLRVYICCCLRRLFCATGEIIICSYVEITGPCIQLLSLHYYYW